MKLLNLQYLFLALAVESTSAKDYEYIVIGAGSAGSIVAAELATSGSDVLIIEAGGDNFDPHIEDMKQYFNVAFNTFNFGFMQWGYETTAQEMTGADGPPQSRIIGLPRGKTLGGSFSINAAAFVQANSEDFNEIATILGDESWSWDRTASFRKKLEKTIGILKLGDEQIGAQNFIDTAAEELGLPFNNDPNSGDQYGIGPSFWTGKLTADGGVRRTSFDAFVLPLIDTAYATTKNQGSVDVVTYHYVEKLIFDPNDPTRVVGVSCMNTRANNIPMSFYATREVIVSAGSYNSPSILLHSGIGPIEHLQEIGVQTKVNLPGVGENLRDHYGIGTFWNLDGLEEDSPFVFQSPVLNMFGPEISGLPSYQIELSGTYGGCQPLRQESVGTVRLQSDDPFASPVIDPKVLDTTNDVDIFVSCLRDYLIPFFTGLMHKGLVSPGNLDPAVVTTDAELQAFVIQNIGSNHHPVGTCKVGSDGDTMAVLDKDFKVRGVSNLRVVDASVFPTAPSGNINAPVMTAAMLASDKIIKDKRNVRARRALRG